MRYRRFSASTLVILAFLVIGLFSSFAASPSVYIIPLAIFAIIFLLYKFPPSSLKRSAYRGPVQMKKTSPKPKKTVPFRVIQGNKQDDEEPPKYH